MWIRWIRIRWIRIRIQIRNTALLLPSLLLLRLVPCFFSYMILPFSPKASFLLLLLDPSFSYWTSPPTAPFPPPPSGTFLLLPWVPVFSFHWSFHLLVPFFSSYCILPSPPRFFFLPWIPFFSFSCLLLLLFLSFSFCWCLHSPPLDPCFPLSLVLPSYITDPILLFPMHPFFPFQLVAPPTGNSLLLLLATHGFSYWQPPTPPTIPIPSTLPSILPSTLPSPPPAWSLPFPPTGTFLHLLLNPFFSCWSLSYHHL
jgi:hypothetical protein